MRCSHVCEVFADDDVLVGIYEVLRVGGGIRSLIIQRASPDEIRQAATQQGMLSLKDYGVMLIKEGLTSTDEVLQCVVVQEGE